MVPHGQWPAIKTKDTEVTFPGNHVPADDLGPDVLYNTAIVS